MAEDLYLFICQGALDSIVVVAQIILLGLIVIVPFLGFLLRFRTQK